MADAVIQIYPIISTPDRANQYDKV